MSEMMKKIAAAVNVSEKTLAVYLSKNYNYPAGIRAKEIAASMGWVPRCLGNIESHRTAMAKVDSVLPTLTKQDSCTLKNIADRLGLGVQTVKRAFGNTDQRNPDLRQKIREAAKLMGYVTPKERAAQRVTWYYGGNFHTADEERARMRQLRDQGYTNREIARKIGRCHTTILNNLGPQDPELTRQTRRIAQQHRAQKNAARAQYLRNKPIAEYNAKVQEHNELKAKLNALQVELLTEKPQIEQTAKITVTAPQMNLVSLQPTALN